MKFSTPKSFPITGEFFNIIQHAVFPDYGDKVSVMKYAELNAKAMPAHSMTGKSVQADSNCARLIYTIVNNSSTIFASKKSHIEKIIKKNKNNEIEFDTFTINDTPLSASDGSLANWLNKSYNGRLQFATTVDCAVFYTLLLLEREECKEIIKPFFEKCLEYIGITELDDVERFSIFNFDWNETKIAPGFENKPYAWLSNKAIECLGLTIFTIFSLVGNDSKVVNEKLPLVYDVIKGLFEKESKISASMAAAEDALWNSIKYFVPRSIQTSNQEMYPQDFFVKPVFKKDGKEVDSSPFSEIKDGEPSKRSIIIAKTGMGKSLFLQMSAICMLNGKHGTQNEMIDRLAEDINAPTDSYVMYIPAKMFSYCYKIDAYNRWTTDLIRLYFNCMWRLSSSVNFYSTSDSQRFGNINVNEHALNDEDFELLEKVIREYARSGKLILILDSFDEIAAGDMRNDYLKALSAFYDNYCEYPEQVGAHVVLASREMSKETMRSVETCLKLESESNASYEFRICNLNPEQRSMLIKNWDKFKNININETSEKINLIENNHCYRDFAVNPYMLSVVCFYFDHSLGDISGRYIDFLVRNMMRKIRDECEEIQQVLIEITEMLQDVANSTISTGNPHFSKGKLTKHIKEKLDLIDVNNDLSEADKDRIINTIHEIIVVSVGLIVPADGKDDAYQFINDQIRYELAAKKIRSNILEQNDITSYYVNGILPAISSIEDYVGVLVPMICAIDLEDPQLSQVLVLDLLMHKASDDAQANDEYLLIRAMLDLLLGRYGSNIITCAIPGAIDELCVRQTQRMLLMRLFSSPAFDPTADEKEKIKASAALTSNITYFSEKFLDMLN